VDRPLVAEPDHGSKGGAGEDGQSAADDHGPLGADGALTVGIAVTSWIAPERRAQMPNTRRAGPMVEKVAMIIPMGGDQAESHVGWH